MPESYDKHGPAKLFATVRCLVPGCGHVAPVDWPQAEQLSISIMMGAGVRHVLGRLQCTKCGYRHTSLEFQLVHSGPQQWDSYARRKERREDPHRTNRQGL